MQKDKEVSIFEFAKAASFDKKDVYEEFDGDRIYSPFMMNMIFSYYMDTILYANCMNEAYSIPKKSNFDFYLHVLSKRKRYSPWVKKPKPDDLTRYYAEECNVSVNVAQRMLDAMSPEERKLQLKEVKEKYEDGN